MATVTQSSETIFDEGEKTEERMDMESNMSFSEQIGSFKFNPKDKVNKPENLEKISIHRKDNKDNTNKKTLMRYDGKQDKKNK